jgi:hypothetical protein
MHQTSRDDIPNKTAFLIATASGRRARDIQALSIKEQHLGFTNEVVQLIPRADYLTIMHFTPIVLPNLRKATSPPD